MMVMEIIMLIVVMIVINAMTSIIIIFIFSLINKNYNFRIPSEQNTKVLQKKKSGMVNENQKCCQRNYINKSF